MHIGASELYKAVVHLEAGDWSNAHEIVQADEESALACWAHGIAHLMEGNESNARYWFHKARRPFPGKASVDQEISALRAAADLERTKR